jgi:hypothetical protein
VLDELENIDDECDSHNITFVKIDDDAEAKEYGIDKLPSLVYFEKGIPTLYEGTWLKFPAVPYLQKQISIKNISFKK